MKVKLFNPGMDAWMPTGAALLGTRHEALTGLTVWPMEPIPPGKFRSITVELDAMESEARGTYTLKLWAEEAGAGSVTLDGVTFP